MAVQISDELWNMLCDYFAEDNEMSDYDFTLMTQKIKLEINLKLEAIAKRKAFTKMKADPSAEERRKGRTEYLDLVGMRESYRTSDFTSD